MESCVRWRSGLWIPLWDRAFWVLCCPLSSIPMGPMHCAKTGERLRLCNTTEASWLMQCTDVIRYEIETGVYDKFAKTKQWSTLFLLVCCKTISSQQQWGTRNISRVFSENWPTPPSFVALTFQNGSEMRNADGRVNSGDDSATFDRNLVSYCQLTPEFRRQFTRLHCV